MRRGGAELLRRPLSCRLAHPWRFAPRTRRQGGSRTAPTITAAPDSLPHRGCDSGAISAGNP